MGFDTMLGVWAGWFALFAVAAALIYGQVRLSRTKSFLPGLIPVVLTFAFFAGAWIWSVNQTGGLHEKTLTQELASGNVLEVTLQLDREDQVIFISPPAVKSKDGVILDYEEWWEGCPLENAFEKLSSQYAFDENTPIDYGHSENSVYIDGAWMNMAVFPACIVIITGPLAVIYILQRWKIRKQKRRDELRRLNIESL